MDGDDQEFAVDGGEQEEFDAGEELRYAEQGDMALDDYCWRLKALANALAQQGEPVDELVLTLHMIRGLSPRFRVMSAALLAQARLPGFMEAFAWLRMEEFELNQGQGAH